jgi:predicted secreted acid phosphatase
VHGPGHGHRHGRHKARHERRAHHARRGDRGHRGGKRLAIVLDIDETSLSNYSAIEADDFTYGPNSQAEADDEVGTAIAPTLALYNHAKSLGVTPFFVTGRPEAQRAVTEDNLRREGYSDWKQLYLKPAGTTLTTVAYKSGARRAIERQGYRIVANIGDQYSDLAGGHAQRAFKLANPFYFLP